MYKLQRKYTHFIHKNFYVEVLDQWLKKSGYEFRYNELAIMWATENNHLHVIEWFKNEGMN